MTDCFITLILVVFLIIIIIMTLQCTKQKQKSGTLDCMGKKCTEGTPVKMYWCPWVVCN